MIESSRPAADRFRVVRQLAEGAFSRVFLAHDLELNRAVALKQLRSRYAGEPRSNARLLFEAEVTAGLEHPGVIPVYTVGRHDDGRAFFTMRLIQGDDLKGSIRRLNALDDPRDFPSRQRRLLERFVDVCYTLDHAHGRGVIHRDISPRNILLGRHGETVLIDWGLAKWIGGPIAEDDDPSGEPAWPASARGLTGTRRGHAMGTPRYLSPEQAAGQPDRHGPASDVYSLGAILYELITGRAPFEGSDAETMKQAQVGDFPAPGQIRDDIDPILEAACLKAMALDPEDRYPRALDLGDEVERWMDGDVDSDPDPDPEACLAVVAPSAASRE